MIEAEQSTAGGALRVIVKIAGVVVLLALLVVVGRRLGNEIPAFIAWVNGFGAWGPLVFIVGYAIATVLFVPGAPLTLAAGAVFGLVRGTAYAYAGAMLGATVAFLVARYGARRRIEASLAAKPRFRAMDRAVGVDGRKIVVLMRLSPVFPFNLLNYALGLTSVSLTDYVVASLAMLPGTLLFVYYGTVAGEVVKASAGKLSRTPGEWTLLAVGLLATIAVTALVARKARAALKSVEEEVEE